MYWGYRIQIVQFWQVMQLITSKRVLKVVDLWLVELIDDWASQVAAVEQDEEGGAKNPKPNQKFS